MRAALPLHSYHAGLLSIGHGKDMWDEFEAKESKRLRERVRRLIVKWKWWNSKLPRTPSQPERFPRISANYRLQSRVSQHNLHNGLGKSQPPDLGLHGSKP